MAYISITRFSGDPAQLLASYERSEDVMSHVGRDHDLIVHAAARTTDGLIVVNLWPSKENSDAAARDPRRLDTLRQSGVHPDQIQREYHDGARYTLFD
jgi:hypothetical protein